MSLGRASNLPGPWCGGRGSWVGRIWLTSQWKWQTLECRKSYHTSQCLHLGGATVRELRSLWIRSGRIFSSEQRYFWGFTCSLSLAACLDEIPITQLQSDLNHSKKNSCVLGYGENTISVIANIWNCAVHYVSWHMKTCREQQTGCLLWVYGKKMEKLEFMPSLRFS